MADTAAVSPIFMQGSGIDTAIAVQQQAIANEEQRKADARAQAAAERAQQELGIKQSLIPSEIQKNQAEAGLQAARANYFSSKADSLDQPGYDVDGLINDATSVPDYNSSLIPELRQQLNPKSSSDSSSSSSSSSDTATPGLAPSDDSMDAAAANSKNPWIPSQSSLSPSDLRNFNIDPNGPLGSVILDPSTSGSSMEKIAQGLPITPENLKDNSAGALADANQASSGDMPTAASDLGTSPVMAARNAAANSVPKWVPETPSDAATPENIAADAKQKPQPSNSGIGRLVSLYDTQISQYTQQESILNEKMNRLQRAARLLKPTDEAGRMKFVAAQIHIENQADALKRNAFTATQDVSKIAGVDPQTLNFLRTTVRDPKAVDAVHQLAMEKNLDHGSAFDFYKAQQAASRKQELDPTAKQALLTKTLGDLKTVTDLKNSGNVTGDTWSSLDAQEKALTAQANQLGGVQISQSPQYVDPLDKFNGINTKLSALNASGVKSTDIDLGGGTKLTGIATDPNKASAIIRPEIMKAAANNNALYDIPHIQDQTATPEIQRFIQDYNQAPAGKNYVITGLPGMIRKDPAISAQQVLAAHFGAYTDKSKQKGAPVITTDSSTNPLVKEFSPENPHAEAALASLKQGVAPSPKDMSGTPYTAANLKAVSDQLAAAQSELEASKGNDWSKLPGTLPNIWSQTFGNGEVGLARAYEAAKQKVATLAAQKAEIESRLGTQKQ